MMKYFAQTVSYLLHPMMLPMYFLFFIFQGDTMFAYIPAQVKLYCYIVTLFSLFFMPLVSLPLLRHFHLIRSYELNEKQERVYPVLVTVIFAFLGFWLLGRMDYTNIVQQLFLVLIILLSVFSVITLRWKISMHMTSIGALCAFLFVIGLKYPGDIRDSFIFILLLAGLLGSCRLYLKKHTPLQVYLGFLFGFVVVGGILL